MNAYYIIHNPPPPLAISPDISLFYIRVMHVFYFTMQQQSYGIWRQLWILKEFVLLRFLLLLYYFSFLSVFLSELFLVRRRKISCDYVLFNLRFGWQMFINFSWYAVRRFQLFFCFTSLQYYSKENKSCKSWISLLIAWNDDSGNIDYYMQNQGEK